MPESSFARGRLSRCLLLAAIFSVPLGSEAQSAPGVAETMPEAYLPELKAILVKALKQAPDMLAQNISIAQAEAGRYSADAVFWPTVSGNLAYSLTASKSDASNLPYTTNTGYNYGVSVGEQVFAWGANKAGADTSKLQQMIAQRQYADAFRVLAGSLRSQYLALITSRMALKNEREQLALQRSSLDLKEQMLKAGNISGAEISGARLAFQTTQLDTDRAEYDFENARTVFRRLAGLPSFPEEAVPSALPSPAYQPAVADALLGNLMRDGGITETLQGQEYALYLKQQDLAYKVAKTRLYPKFYFSGGYSLSYDVPLAQSYTTYSASLSAGWTIFDGFATRGAKLSALANRRSYEQQLRRFTDTTLDNAQGMRKQLALQARALDLAETRRALARDGLAHTQEEFKSGTVSQFDVDAARAGFNQADYAAVIMRMTYLNRWSEFVSLTGNDPLQGEIPANYRNLATHGQ